MNREPKININDTYEFILQPHELLAIKKTLNSQRIPFSEENLTRFLVSAITEKVRKDYCLNNNARFLSKQLEMEASYAGAK